MHISGGSIPGFTKGGKDEAPQAPRSSAVGQVERHRREDRGAAGAEGVVQLGKGPGEGAMPHPRKNLSILDLKLATLGAFWALFFTVQLFGLSLEKLLLQARKQA